MALFLNWGVGNEAGCWEVRGCGRVWHIAVIGSGSEAGFDAIDNSFGITI